VENEQQLEELKVAEKELEELRTKIMIGMLEKKEHELDTKNAELHAIKDKLHVTNELHASMLEIKNAELHAMEQRVQDFPVMDYPFCGAVTKGFAALASGRPLTGQDVDKTSGNKKK
jgi:hypothetical protein